MKNTPLREDRHTISAKAPATLSNLAVGFDMLGVAISGPHDTVTLRKRDDALLVITTIDSPQTLPTDNNKNTATIALQSVLESLSMPVGFDVDIHKGIPPGSGMGSSAASAVAALTAFNGFLLDPLSLEQLLPHAANAEAALCGTAHCDNVAPCLWGGLVLCHDASIMRLPCPEGLLLITKPDIRITTKAARACLPNQVTLSQGIDYARHLGCWLQALHAGDSVTAARHMVDHIIEPSRADLWPHYQPIKNIAQKTGALATCMSGSGPAVMSWVTESTQEAVQTAIQRYCDSQPWDSLFVLSPWSAPGAVIVEAI